VVDDSAPLPSTAGFNPLRKDMALFEAYINVLDGALANPEIRIAVDELSIPIGRLRNRMVAEAGRVLRGAPREFAEYQRVLALERDAPDIDARMITHGSRRDLAFVMRVFLIVTTVPAVISLAAGLSAVWAWPPAVGFIWAGGAMLTVVPVMWIIRRVLDSNFRSQVFEILNSDGSYELVHARELLIIAISDTELLAQIRTFLNEERQVRLGNEYSVTSSPGLSEVYDSVNRVPTRISSELEELLGHLDGASIGIAGQRGSGKSMLIRRYCEDASSAPVGRDESGSALPAGAASVRDDLRCLVSAPVNYVAQDFVLHLFATFCRAVIQSFEKEAKTGRASRVFRARRVRRLAVSVLWRVVVYGGVATVLLLWQSLISRHIGVSAAWVRYAAWAVIGLGTLDLIRSLVFKVRRWSQGEMGVLEAMARRHLSQVRYLQTYTTGWTGGLTLPGGSQGQFSRGVSRAEQPLSYPDIVDEFRNFARRVADEAHRAGFRVFIGVDELDKIGSADQAERFLNEIKGIFGIRHLYFMVSVSDDALTAFERRGLPLRDAFDSSFDEIVHVGPLSYLESRRLLYRRVVGLSEPYVALCHCLSGGLARDLIRAARNVVRAAVALTSQPSEVSGAAECSQDYFTPPAIDNVEYGEYAEDIQLGSPGVRELTLGAISSAVIRGELLRKLQAISHVAGAAMPGRITELQDDLNDAARRAAREGTIRDVVDLMIKPGLSEPSALADLRFDFTAYAYYCTTLQDVFTDRLDDNRIVRATSDPRSAAGFDALAGIRNALGLDTMLAWQMISQFRTAWGSLDICEPTYLVSPRRRRRGRSAAGQKAAQPDAVRPVKAS
jgi:hypothetical protein